MKWSFDDTIAEHPRQRCSLVRRKHRNNLVTHGSGQRSFFLRRDGDRLGLLQNVIVHASSNKLIDPIAGFDDSFDTTPASQ